MKKVAVDGCEPWFKLWSFLEELHKVLWMVKTTSGITSSESTNRHTHGTVQRVVHCPLPLHLSMTSDPPRALTVCRISNVALAESLSLSRLPATQQALGRAL